MKRTPFAVRRQIQLAVDWYGNEYEFTRRDLNNYGEPTNEESLIQTVSGIYHESERSFIELVNNESASVKSKVNKGILCGENTKLLVQQEDKVLINGVEFYVTAVEPVLYSGEAIAQEISIEELVKGNDT